jgi:hypothetical protein
VPEVTVADVVEALILGINASVPIIIIIIQIISARRLNVIAAAIWDTASPSVLPFIIGVVYQWSGTNPYTN